MDNEEYLLCQTQVITFAQLILNIPLEEFLEKADRAETLGPIIDPTLWREANIPFSKIVELAGLSAITS